MSTRAVVYFHHKDEKKNNLNYTMKLYHHRDGYPEYLWEKLKKIFKDFKDEYENNNSGSMRSLFSALGKEEWFEMTYWYHSDAEYVYHIYYEDERGFGEWEKKFNFKICIQQSDDYEWCRDDNMITWYDSKAN